MKPTIKDIVASQSWIEGVKRSESAMTAFRVWQKFMVPSSIRLRLKAAANSANVPYEDLALMNLAYESSMVAMAGIPSVGDLVKSMLSSGFPATAWGCSCFGVVENVGDWQMGAVHARNLDWPDPGDLLRKSTLVEKEGKLPYWTVGFPGQAGVLTGSADHRFSISLNTVYTDQAAWGYAPVYLIREVLEKCKTFDEALRMICERRLMVGALFLLVDGNPNLSKTRIVVIERTPDKYYVRRQKDYGNSVSAVICTNDYLGIKPKEAGVIDTGEELQETSCGRFCSIEKELNSSYDTFSYSQPLKTLKHRDVRLGCTIHHVLMYPAHAVKPEVYNP